MKKRILVIGTGGTIASVKTKDGLRPALKTDELLPFFPKSAEIAHIEGKMLFNLDSTNIQPHHWSEIAREIERQYDKYDGFVITHGTDTMQYTSAALSFMLQNISKPVVLTGSVKATTEKGSDAKQNFIDSIIVANSQINGISIVFHGKIIKGYNARKITNEATKSTNEGLDVYSSINNHILGELIGKLEDNSKRKIILERGYLDIQQNQKGLKVLSQIDDSGNILLLKIYPGFRPAMLDKMSASIKCIIIEAFGPGNIPFIENSLIEKIEEFTRKKSRYS